MWVCPLPCVCHATCLLCHSEGQPWCGCVHCRVCAMLHVCCAILRDSLGVGVFTAVCVPCYMFVVPF